MSTRSGRQVGAADHITQMGVASYKKGLSFNISTYVNIVRIFKTIENKYKLK